MFTEKDLTKDVRVMVLGGTKYRGIVAEVKADSVVIELQEPFEEKELQFMEILTVTRIGEFGDQ